MVPRLFFTMYPDLIDALYIRKLVTSSLTHRDSKRVVRCGRTPRLGLLQVILDVIVLQQV